MKILNWRTGAVIWEGAATTMQDAVWAAIASGASLSCANLSRADLSGADLSGASLSWANLSRANLSRANLSGANLSGADLSWANLSRANLSCASLSWVNLSGADLSGADLSGASGIAPPMLLLASWGDVSDDLCADLMHHDAANHPNGAAAFAAWAQGGACPYERCRVGRSAHFNERQDCWRPERPVQTALQLMDRLLAEKTKTRVA